MHIYNWYHTNVSDIFYVHEHGLQYTWRIPLAFCLPLPIPLCSPFYPLYLLLTWNPPSCDRIRPPQSQVACKLTSPVPTLSPNPPPSKFPEPQLPSASLRRPQELSGVFCPEHSPLEVVCDLVTCPSSSRWPSTSPLPLASRLLRMSRAACFSRLLVRPAAPSFFSCLLLFSVALLFRRACLTFFSFLFFFLPLTEAALSLESSMLPAG
jgi:hypothetical protein